MYEARLDDLLFEALGESLGGDAQHPRVLAIVERIAAGELTFPQARPLLRQTLAEIEMQERSWECVFVN